MDLCARSAASLVLAPCCYGQIAKPPPAFEVTDNDLVTFPPASTSLSSAAPGESKQRGVDQGSKELCSSVVVGNDLSNTSEGGGGGGGDVDFGTSSVGIITAPQSNVLASIQTMSQFHVLLKTPSLPQAAVVGKRDEEGTVDVCTENSSLSLPSLTEEPFSGLMPPLHAQSPFQTIISGADFANNFDDAQTGGDGPTESAPVLKESFLLAKRCMRLVDFDRAFHFLSTTAGTDTDIAREKGRDKEEKDEYSDQQHRYRYQFRLTSLFPLSCSPKNNVIVGRCLIPCEKKSPDARSIVTTAIIPPNI